MSFVPPKVNQNVWATHVQTRSPNFKVHSSQGLAHSAVGYHFPENTVTMYHLENGEWAVYRVFERPTECDRCHGTLKVTGYGRTYTQFRRPYKQRGQARFDEPVICESCYNVERDAFIQKQQKQRELKQLAELKAKYKGHDND